MQEYKYRSGYSRHHNRNGQNTGNTSRPFVPKQRNSDNEDNRYNRIERNDSGRSSNRSNSNYKKYGDQRSSYPRSENRGGYGNRFNSRLKFGGRPAITDRSSEDRPKYNTFRPREGQFTHNYKHDRSSGRSFGRTNRFSGTKINPQRYIAKAVVDAAPVSIYSESDSYTDFNLLPQLIKNIEGQGYDKPTKIQAKTIPAVIQGRDVIALASTGSGKTAAYLLPMINKILKDRKQKCMVILPTRELAEQTNVEFIKFSKGTGLRSAVLIGGSSMYIQKKDLYKNPNIVIATPGRLKDLANQGAVLLNTFDNVILDEVDRMLDMGFVHEIKELISKMKENKQSVFLSATMSKEAESIARDLLHDPVRVQTETISAQANVDQDIVRVAGSEKFETLKKLLEKEEFIKVLVFAKTRRGADRLSNDLYKAGFKADSIHGDKTQAKRSLVIKRFRENSIKILVATDVAARGLDIKDITHVINYDEPNTYDDYIHRIGRTGRIGKKGVALTFVG